MYLFSSFAYLSACQSITFLEARRRTNEAAGAQSVVAVRVPSRRHAISADVEAPRGAQVEATCQSHSPASSREGRMAVHRLFTRANFTPFLFVSNR